MLGKKVSVIIVSYNVQYFLELCLHSVIRSLQNINAEIIVVDNNSSDNSCDLVRHQFPEVNLIANSDNAGFSRANNQGLTIASGTYIHFLNPDTVVPEDFYQKTIQYLDEHEDVGCIGPRLIDGRGLYAVDSKKSFPSFWTSVFKLCGLSKFFPNSPVFNKYYAAQVDEMETAPVDILSGCCLLVRNSAMMESGGGFDESYFMYCEDVDLCHRIRMKGYKNVYFPQVNVVHYKGESTRKLSYRYMKIFYEAHALFVKKYYPKNLGIAYISALRFVLFLRNILNWTRHLFLMFKMFILDIILLSITTVAVKNLWFDSVAQFQPSNNSVFIKTIPIFVLIWLTSLFFSGAYDKPFSLFKAGRGMVIGTILVLAGYGIMPLEFRYSRGIVLFSGMAATLVLILARWLLAAAKWIKLVPRGKVDYKTAVVGSSAGYTEAYELLKENHYALEVIGRIAETEHDKHENIGSIQHLPELQKIYRINELVFDSGSLSYISIMKQMERCTPNAFYKIHVPNSKALVGSNNSRHHADEYSLSKKYQINSASNKRNKRLIDILIAIILIICYPIGFFIIKHKSRLLRNILHVLKGNSTWVGYKSSEVKPGLPKLKTPIIPAYIILENFEADNATKSRIAENYARDYNVLDDIRMIWVNRKYLGGAYFD